jgi:hypothetical protein
MNTVKDAFNAFYPGYANGHSLSDQQQKAARAIMNCHTEAMGANVSVCDGCGHRSVHYNSCRNRHCPACQGVNGHVWADARAGDTVNAPYFHVVFTVPEQLRMVIYHNKELLYGLMYRATAETIFTLAGDSKYLGAKTGFFSVLHTWGQNLHYHPHIHTAIVGGGLTGDRQWQSSGKKFFIPVKVLAKLFRGRFLVYLKSLYYDQKLEFFGQISRLNNPSAFESLLTKLYNTEWYAYTKRAFSGPQAVVKYLARYTHRIAIANSRIASIGENTVSFNVQDHDANATGVLTLTGSEFIRRFLLHVLPLGFVRIRYYGILAVRNRKTLLVLCMRLTNTTPCEPKLKGLKPVGVVLVLFGKDLTKCHCCGKGTLVPLCGLGSSP